MSIGSVITKSPLKVGSISIVYFPFTLFDSIPKTSNKSISITMYNFCWPIECASLPSALYLDLP